MAPPAGIPDEFIRGFIASAQTLWQLIATGRPLADAATARDKAPTKAAAPGTLAELQLNYFQQHLALWSRMMSGAGGQTGEPMVTPDRGDRRFHAAEWRDIPGYSLVKQSYLLNARLVGDLVEAAALDPRAKHRLRFYARQMVDMLSPANFAVTNPEVVKLALESKGQSLLAGFENLSRDLHQGRLSITDETAFEVGKDVAASAGAVVFENALFQLIQYAPLTEQVATHPLLIVPPCINKFYILDLQPENSFVRFAAEQGNTVFLVSWRNPDAECSHFTWDDYVELGVLKAIEAALAISGADKVNTVGWCVGGTILASALAVLRRREEAPVASLTLLTTMLDFSEPGDLGVFTDESTIFRLEQRMA